MTYTAETAPESTGLGFWSHGSATACDFCRCIMYVLLHVVFCSICAVGLVHVHSNFGLGSMAMSWFHVVDNGG
ncbi:unnamed protein product [Lathyrus oleraceus]